MLEKKHTTKGVIPFQKEIDIIIPNETTLIKWAKDLSYVKRGGQIDSETILRAYYIAIGYLYGRDFEYDVNFIVIKKGKRQLISGFNGSFLRNIMCSIIDKILKNKKSC